MFTCREIQLDEDIGWDSLVEGSRNATFFQRRDWLKLWVKHFGRNPYIVGIFDDENCIGIAPFDKIGHSLEFLGSRKILTGEYVSDYGDIIAVAEKEDEVWNSLLSFLKGKSGITFQLYFIRQDSPSVPILERENFHKERTDVASQMILPSSWDDYLLTLPRHERHELRRKLKKSGVSRKNIIVSNGTSSDIEMFFRLMAASSPEKSAFLTDAMKEFFGDVIFFYSNMQMAHMIFLRCDEKIIAGALLFFFRNDVLLYNSGFDRTYYQMAPGYILTTLLIQKAIEEKKTRFDFLRGSERYKFDLGAKGVDLYTFRSTE